MSAPSTRRDSRKPSRITLQHTPRARRRPPSSPSTPPLICLSLRPLPRAPNQAEGPPSGPSGHPTEGSRRNPGRQKALREEGGRCPGGHTALPTLGPECPPASKPTPGRPRGRRDPPALRREAGLPPAGPGPGRRGAFSGARPPPPAPPPTPRTPLFCGPLPPLPPGCPPTRTPPSRRTPPPPSPHRPAMFLSSPSRPSAVAGTDGRTDGLPVAQQQHARFQPPPPPRCQYGNRKWTVPHRAGRAPTTRARGGAAADAGQRRRQPPASASARLLLPWSLQRASEHSGGKKKKKEERIKKRKKILTKPGPSSGFHHAFISPRFPGHSSGGRCSSSPTAGPCEPPRLAHKTTGEGLTNPPGAHQQGGGRSKGPAPSVPVKLANPLQVVFLESYLLPS